MGKFNKTEVARAQSEWREAKKQMEFILEYPPFFMQEEDDDGFSMSLPTDEFNKIQPEFVNEVKRIHNLISESDAKDATNIDPDIFAEPFADLENKYADELEEARLWMKRFPTEPDKAVRKKLKG